MGLFNFKNDFMGQIRILNSVMETRGHSKNGASPKSQMSRGNFSNN